MAAQKERATVLLEPPSAPTMAPISMQTTIEEVRGADLVIAQPFHEGSTRQLVTGEALRMSFSLRPFGHVTATTRVLGRIRKSTESGATFYGYRLEIPQSLRRVERRRGERANVGVELSREAELYKLDDQSPIRGIVQNLSVSGVQVRTHNTRPPISKGERLRLVVYMPPPVGEVNRMVTVSRVSVDRNPRFRLVAIAFDRELAGVAELIKDLKRNREPRN